MTPAHHPEMQAVVNAACQTYGLLPKLLLSRNRTAHVAYARQTAMAALMDQYGWSSLRVGRAFHMNHATVLYARDTVRSRCETEAPARRDLRLFLAYLCRWRSQTEVAA